MEVQGAVCAVGIRLSPVDGMPPRVSGSATFLLPVVSRSRCAPRGAVITRKERFASTAARNQRKCWVAGSQTRDQAARLSPAALALPCGSVLSCCLGMLGVCPVPAAPVLESGCCDRTVWTWPLGGLGLPGICPVPGARAFLHHAVSAAARVLRPGMRDSCLPPR
jgi:hypothetical protein